MAKASRTLYAAARRRNPRHHHSPHVRVRGLVAVEDDDGIEVPPTPPPDRPVRV
jgi:hypothetical protein